MTGIKRSSKQILPMVIGSTLVLGLIWLNTFIHQNSFSDSYGDFSFLIEIIPAVSLATLLNTLVMFRSAVWQSTYSTADCAQDAAWGAIAMMAQNIVIARRPLRLLKGSPQPIMITPSNPSQIL